MNRRGPVIDQDMLLRLLASYELAAADYEAVRRLLRMGAIEEDGPLALNLERFREGPPRPLVIARPAGEDEISARKRRFAILQRIAGGEDIHSLQAAGLHAAADRRRKANARVYRQLVKELDCDVRASLARQLDVFYHSEDWSDTEDLWGRAFRAHFGVFRLRVGSVLYALGMPWANVLATGGLGPVQVLLDSAGATAVTT
jgi:hypothetical protein